MLAPIILNIHLQLIHPPPVYLTSLPVLPPQPHCMPFSPLFRSNTPHQTLPACESLCILLGLFCPACVCNSPYPFFIQLTTTDPLYATTNASLGKPPYHVGSLQLQTIALYNLNSLNKNKCISSHKNPPRDRVPGLTPLFSQLIRSLGSPHWSALS